MKQQETGQSVPPDITFIRLGAEINRLMLEHHVPGAAVGVLYEGQTYTAGFGINHITHSLPITDDTLFQIGSISKTFAATLVMQLVQEGKLDLDAPLQRYLPGFSLADQEVAAQATLRHLLTHTGNWIGDFFADTGEGDDATARYMVKMAQLEQLMPLGSTFSYNNAGFYLIGHLVEAVTGETFENALRAYLLDPLGMTHCYLRASDVMMERFVVGHNKREHGLEVARPWPLPRAAQAAGGITSSIKELLRYARFQMSGETADGVQLLTPETRAEMQSPQISRWNEQESIGLSWFIDDDHGIRAVSHGGSTVGQMALLAMIPAQNFAVVLLTNSNTGGALNRDAYRAALHYYWGIEKEAVQSIAMTEQMQSEYVGTYTRPMARIELQQMNATEENEPQLRFIQTYRSGFPTEDTPPRPPLPPMRCVLCETDRLLILDGPLKDTKVDILRDEQGGVGWIRSGLRIHQREG